MRGKRMELVEVALAAGFADQAHMTRSFRQTIGLTPGGYRAGLC
ncbi:MAG: helix-turn-helix domain-containing protein [Sphingomonadales bacterium]